MKSTREQAIEWWNNLHILTKQKHAGNYCTTCDFVNLTGREIEEIWKKEHELFVAKAMGDKPQVDFEMLKSMLSVYDQLINKHTPILSEEHNNTKLFFNLLTKSSSFAHKVHKELNRLNK